MRAAFMTMTCLPFLLALFLYGQAPQREAKRVDEWQTLEMTLQGQKSEQPRNGFVPDETTASRIGEAVAMAFYGQDKIARQRPFRAHLRGDVWTVIGTLYPKACSGAPRW
jgi:hypothetical protein